MRKIILSLLLLCVVGIQHSQAQCNAQFSWAQTPQHNNLLHVTFTNTSTGIPNGNNVATINFGDGTYTENFYAGAMHNYGSPGTYTVIVGISSTDPLTPANSCHDSIAATVTVAYPACGSTIASTYTGGSSYTFTTSTPAGTAGLTYNWNFGDGNTASGTTVSHTYTTGGSFNVSLQATGSGCTYSNTMLIAYVDSALDCSVLTADFDVAVSGLGISLTNTSTYFPYFSQVNVSSNEQWLFGDGGSIPTSSPSHLYAVPGTYAVTLIHSWVDSFTQVLLCQDSTVHLVTVDFPAGPNTISGKIYWDSTASTDSIAGFNVWLIELDGIAGTLTAIDSDMVSASNAHYSFLNEAVGNYFVKAAPVFSGIPSAFGVVPTYHDSSLYWSGASTVTHAAGATTGKDIWMRNGTITAGPGFVGGNISSGAGKGTGTGVPGLLVFLRNNATDELVSSAYTDANGDYSFSNLATGSYNVYPEAMSYTTTASPVLSVTAGQTSNTGIDFVQTEDQIKPKSLSIAGVTKEDGISIYPNPASDILIIENKAGKFTQVSMVNTLGQVVKQQNINKGNNKIEISTMTSGLYYVIINGNEATRSVKISKK